MRLKAFWIGLFSSTHCSRLHHLDGMECCSRFLCRVTVMDFTDQKSISESVYCIRYRIIRSGMVCKLSFSSEFPDILKKSWRRRWRKAVNAKRFAFQANATNSDIPCISQKCKLIIYSSMQSHDEYE